MTGSGTESDAESRRLFAGPCMFVVSASAAGSLPAPTLPEVAFAGRSNVGKSSLINALVGRNGLARTSKTPGATRTVNFFDLGGRLMLVDLPGYGYARVGRAEARSWSRVATDYLKGRAKLRRACLLVDSRIGLKDSDRIMMDRLDEAAVSYQVVLTKSDEPSAGALTEMQRAVAGEARKHVAAYPEIVVTSARTGEGMDALRRVLAALAAPSQSRYSPRP